MSSNTRNRFASERSRERINEVLVQKTASARDSRKSSSRRSLHGSDAEILHTVISNNSETNSLKSTTKEATSAIELLSQPIKKLEVVIQDLIDYKRDAEFAASKASDLAHALMSNNSVENNYQLLIDIHKLARNQASRFGLVTCPELIQSVIYILQSTTNTMLLSESALILQLLSKCGKGAKLASEQLGIISLVKMLKHPNEIIYTTALYILNQIMWYFPQESRSQFRSCSGQYNLIDLLEENKIDDPNWLLICIDTLRMAVYESSDTKLTLLSTNLYDHIIRLLRTYPNNLKMAYNIARLLKVLSVCNANKAKLVKAGAVEALTRLLSSDNEALQLETLWGLRNISDQAYHLIATKQLIPLLIGLLASKNEHISICSAGCLCNLTCQNTQNKCLLVEKGGVKFLCELLKLNSDRQEIAEPVCSALRHVTHRNPHANSAIYEIRTSQTISIIVRLLVIYQSKSALPLLKSVVGLIRNIATESECRKELRDYQTSSLLVRVLNQTYDMMTEESKYQDTLESDGAETLECVEGVKLGDMLELIMATLQIMAKDRLIQEELIYTAGLLTNTVQLTYSTSLNLQRSATALLSQLSTSRAGCIAIENEGVCPRLTELIQSDNEYIAAYSAAILHHIAQDKPNDYKHRLSLELRQSLFDGGLDDNNEDNLEIMNTSSMNNLNQ